MKKIILSKITSMQYSLKEKIKDLVVEPEMTMQEFCEKYKDCKIEYFSIGPSHALGEAARII